MSVANCSRCGGIFNKVKNPACEICQAFLSGLADKILIYIQTHAGTTIAQLAEKFKCTIQDIDDLLNTSALIRANHLILVQCHQCHRELTARERNGYFCPGCSQKIFKECDIKIQISKPEALPVLKKIDHSSSGFHSTRRHRS